MFREVKLLQRLRDSNARSSVIPTMGSDPTAAGGGRREGSEWQRSARDEGKLPRTFAGNRNRGSEATQIRNLQSRLPPYNHMVGIKK